MNLDYLIFNTSSGWMGILGSQDGLRRLVLPQSSPEQAWHLLSEFVLRWHEAILAKTGSSYFGDLPQRMKDYLDGRPVSFPDKLDLSRASPFQRRVWQITQSITYGEVKTYAWIAGKLGMPKAARVAGQALARNPLPIIIPCHRVIRGDGSLGGFSGGRGWKQRLLKIEAKTV
jgi:O-6-methylguanine DNA methyltransferase